MKKMNEVFGALLSKKMITIVISIILGALAHSLYSIKKHGWKGWFDFLSDTIVSIFTGYVFYHFALVTYPEYAVIFCSMGSFWGVTAFKYIREWFVNTLKANLA